MAQVEQVGTVELSREECLSLLAGAPFGRLVITEGALPAVLPVNFLLDPAGIVIRTAEGSSTSLADGSVVAFQADSIDVVRQAGWTVTVVGRATVVRDELQRSRLAALPLQPWAPGRRDTLVVVDLGLVSGRRIGGAEPAHAVPDVG